MALYTPVTGIISNIEQQSDCSTHFTIQSETPRQGQIHFHLPSDAYVLNLHPFQLGDRATFFYPANAPVPLIYPPRYRAAAAAHTPHGVTAVLDMFSYAMTNSDNTLLLTPSWNTPVTLPNGQTYTKHPGGHLLMATYTASSRSIPARATPEQIVVFCGRV